MIVARCSTVIVKITLILSLTLLFNTIPRFEGFLLKPTTTPQTPLLSIRAPYNRAFEPQSLKRETTTMVPSRYFMSSSSGSDNNDTTNDNVEPIPTTSSPSSPLPSSDVIPDDSSSSSSNTPKQSANRPILGEVSIDGSLLVIIPALVIGILGIVFSIVVAFNARDEFVVVEVSSPPKEVRVDDGSCRGICADQEGSLKDLSQLMESLRRTE